MADANLLKIDLDIVEAIREGKSTLAQFKENKTYNKQSYDVLLTKYGDAIKLIERLQDELADARTPKMPAPEEISGALTLLGSLDQISEAMPKLAALQSQVNKLNRKGRRQ